MKRRNSKQKWFCILMTLIMSMAILPWGANADGGILHLRGISAKRLAETGEIGISICATNGVGEGISIKPTDLQVLINTQPVEVTIDRNSTRGHIFVIDYSLSTEGKRWTYVTESTASLISGLIKWADITDEMMVVWVGESNLTETINANDIEASYRTKRESVNSNTAHIYDGIEQAVELAEGGAGGYDYYSIYVLTDGQDNGSKATLDYLSKKAQDSNSPISLFVGCYFNGSRTPENTTAAETVRKALNQFTLNLDGVYESFDIQRTNAVATLVKRALNKYAEANYGLMNVRVALDKAPLDRKNGQTEIYVGLVAGGTAKKKTIYLPIDELPPPSEISMESLNLQAIIDEKDSQIETLVSGAALKDVKIESLEKKIEEQAAIISGLEVEASANKIKIEELESDVADKATKIKTLETDLAKAATQIKTMEEETARKDATIDTLQADVTDKTVRIETLEEDIAGKTQRINNLETEISGKTREIERLEGIIEEKSSKIETLEDDVTEKKTQINTLATELTSKITEIETLQTTVKDKDTEIETLITTINEKNNQIDKQKADISDKEIQIEGLSASNRAQEAQLQVFKQKILEEGIDAGYDGTKSLLVIVPTKDYVIERLSAISDVGAIAAVTIDNDPNGQLGKEGQYIEQIYFSSSLVDQKYAGNPDIDVISAGTVCGGSVEVYRTITDAMEREKHLAYYDGSTSSTGSHTVVGTVVIRTSSSLSLVEQRKLENAIIESLISGNE